MPHVISIAIVEDQRPTRDALTSLVDRTPGFRAAGSFASMEDALAALDAPADVLLTDIGLPGMSGIEGVRALKARHPGMQVLMLTVFADSDHVFEAICAGASGYLLKDTPRQRLLDALREICEGGAPMSSEIARKVVTMFQEIAPPKTESQALSRREIDVLKLLADGHGYKTAAATIGISTDGVRFHVRNIYDKLHVHSKSEAVTKAFRRGLLR